MGVKAYLNFDLLIDRAEQGYIARVLDAPAGPAKNRFSLPFSDLELENLFLRVGRSRRVTRRMESPEAEAIKSFGGRLYDSVFSGPVGSSLRSSLDMAAERGAGLRIRLHLSEVPDLVDLPWEFLYNPALNRFFGLSRSTPIVRYLDLQEVIQPLAIQPPLRILAVIASPIGYPPLDVEQEWAKLQESVRDLVDQGLVVLDRLQQPTLSSLQRRLRQVDYHVFHFVGHGAFDTSVQDGLLIMQDASGMGRPVSGQDLGTLLHDQRSLRLAMLNACEGARSSHTDPFAGTAQSLVQQGIPAVIAMQFEISDAAAITVSHEFYAAVADGYPVDAALSEARKAVFADSNTVEWGTPVLYLRAPDGRIFDVAQEPAAPHRAPKEAVAPPPAPVAALRPVPANAETRPEETLASSHAATPDTGRVKGSGLPQAELAAARPVTRHAEISAPLEGPGQRGKRRLWPGIAAGIVALLAAGIVFSGLGQSVFGRQPAAENSPALQSVSGVPGLSVASPGPAVSPTPGQPTVAAVLASIRPTESPPLTATAPPPTRTPMPTDTPPPPTNTPAPPTNTPPPPPTNTALPPTNSPPVNQRAAPGRVAPTPAPTAIPAAPQASLSGAAALDLASGSWVRGQQPYGTLTAQSVAGSSALGQLDYNIPGDAKDHFVVFRHVPPVTLAGQPAALTLWVYGDGSGNFLNVWVRDQAGMIRQFSFGRVLHDHSWQAMTAQLDTSAPWPQTRIDGPDSANLTYPISIFAVVLDAFPKSDVSAYTGTIYMEQLQAGTDPGKAPAVEPRP